MNLLQTTQLTKYFGNTHAVDAVDFAIGEMRRKAPLFL